VVWNGLVWRPLVNVVMNTHVRSNAGILLSGYTADSHLSRVQLHRVN
jgi:hypothetical protein